MGLNVLAIAFTSLARELTDMHRVKRRELWIGAVVALVIAGFSVAKQVDLPNVFSPNTPARASEVNANFAAVKSAVDDSQSQIDRLTARLSALEGGGTWNDLPLENGWTNYGGGFQEAQYRLDATGTVHLRGLVRLDTVVAPSAISTLPPGFRPLKTELFALVATDALGRIDINAEGRVVFIFGKGTYVQLSGISFTVK
jgi:hypothetical protein